MHWNVLVIDDLNGQSDWNVCFEKTSARRRKKKKRRRKNVRNEKKKKMS
jgi:hypothetical protein